MKYATIKEYKLAVRLGVRLVSTYTEEDKNDFFQEYADDLFNLAIVQEQLEDFEKAGALYTESAQVLKEHTGQTLMFMYRIHNLGVLHCKKKEYESGIELLTESIEIIEMLKEQNVAEYQTSFYNIGNAYIELREFEKALEALAKLVELGNRDTEFAMQIIISICHVLELVDDYDSAVYYMERALKVMVLKKIDSSEYIRYLFFCGKLCETAKNFERAVYYYEEVIAQLRKHHKAPYYPSCLNSLAHVFELAGSPDKAVAYRLQALDQVKRSIGENHMHYANNLKNISDYYKKKKEFELAVEFLQNCIAVKRRILGDGRIEYIRDMLLLLDLFIESNQDTKALDLILDIIESVGENREEMDDVVTRLAKVYMSLGDINSLNDIFNRAMKKYDQDA